MLTKACKNDEFFLSKNNLTLLKKKLSTALRCPFSLSTETHFEHSYSRFVKRNAVRSYDLYDNKPHRHCYIIKTTS